MKKLHSLIIAAVFFAASLFSSANFHASRVKHYVFENGFQVFLLENSADALVHINFIVKAGFSSQTRQTNGFFKLYTRLFNSAAGNLDSAECSSDFSKYKITVTNSQLDETLNSLSSAAFNLHYSDEALNLFLNQLKDESSLNSSSAAGFINAAIDSRVFSSSPWQHDSGIYPPLFKKTTLKNARTILTGISQKYYTPQNSAIFISGNFNTEHILNQLKNTFGYYYSAYPAPSGKNFQAANSQRRFVLHHPDFSPDMTQIVIQYTTLNIEQSELLSAAINFPVSSLKKILLEKSQLNIPGDEYINASAAHKKNSSRIIIQSLLQIPEGKNKPSSCTQSLDFLQTVLQIPQITKQNELNFAKNMLFSEFDAAASEPEPFMDKLSEFWAIEQYYASDSDTTDSQYDSQTVYDFMNKKEAAARVEYSDLMKTFETETPFVFVLISDADFKKTKAEYKAAGFEEISKDNASWYTLQMFREIRNQLEPDNEPVSYSSKNSIDNDYFKHNFPQIKKHRLENGITLTEKPNKNSSDVTFLISIDGGELNTAKNHGFEEVMINLMAAMIQKEINSKLADGIIMTPPAVSTQTKLSSSSIIISCQKEDFTAVCNSAANAIIYGDIPPAAADRTVSARRYKKRLENGSAVHQLYSRAIAEIFPASPLTFINNTTVDILENTNYSSILQAFPEYLNAARYNLILTGDYEDTAVETIKKAFSLFSIQGEFKTEPVIMHFPKNKSISQTVIHTFLTDIPAEKAGPQPAVLIPTTEFLDPIVYAIKAPEAGTEDAAIFCAILNYLEFSLEKQLSENQKFANTTVQILLPEPQLNAGFVIFQNIKSKKEIDLLYKTTIQNTNKAFTSPAYKTGVFSEVKAEWTKRQMNLTSSNKGTAILMQRGIELNSADFYLTEYNQIQTAGPQKYIDLMSYFPELPEVRIYSKDSKQ